MKRRILLSLLAFMAILAGFMPSAETFAQGAAPPQGLTAQEMLEKGNALFLQGKYTEAAALFQSLQNDYSKSIEAAPLIRSTRFRHAMALIGMKKFDESTEAIKAALAVQPPLQPAEVQELTFWLGVASIETEQFPAARAAFEKFISMFPAGAERNPNYVQQFPAAVRIPEARLMIGNAWLLEEKFNEAADYYGKMRPEALEENRGRAAVLELYSLLQAERTEEALRLVNSEYPRMAELIQLITFQTLMLDLGNRFLEQGDFRKAISCLQRLWPAERLLRHQEERLESMESKLQALQAVPRPDVYQKYLLTQLIQKTTREIDHFRKIAGFDAALRLRLATAYQAMKRYRESALILEDMLERLPPDSIVEQASANLVQTWFEIERWPKVTTAAATFEGKFPNSKSLPLILYVAGLAAQKDNRYDESVTIFADLRKRAPDSEYAPRALFMTGFTLLLAERNTEAIEAFEDFLKKYPGHELAEAASYWRGMAYSLDKQYAKARELLEEHLKRYKEGQFSGDAAFRRAYCAQQLEDYQTSIREFRTYLRSYPGHDSSAEARILLGDALMNEGDIEEGIAVLKGIPVSQPRQYEEAVFKIAKAYKLTEQLDKYRDLMVAFQTERPKSPRVAEAVYNLGWYYRQLNQPDKARDIYWQAITSHGNDADALGIEDVFTGLARLYKGPEESAQLLALLGDMTRDANAAGQRTLSARTLWARACVLKKSDPAQSRDLMIEAAAKADVQTTSPRLLADCADALMESGREQEGESMSRELIRWNPRAVEKDRALATLGFLELKRGNEKAALELFNRFQTETLGSAAYGKVLLAKAGLLFQRGRKDEARATLDALLANQSATGKEKAEALYLLGSSYMSEDKPKLAIPYFQRIYVMHAKWRDWVAKAYLASGAAFEKLNDTSSARRTYQEFTGKEDMADTPEFKSATDRLEALGGPIKESVEPAPARG